MKLNNIINKISFFTKIPKLFVANIRKNCLILDIVRFVRKVRRLLNDINDLIHLIRKIFAGEIGEELINEHGNELRQFLNKLKETKEIEIHILVMKIKLRLERLWII